ncbi:MAG: hypothetical protein ACC650_07765, partial [Gammaproteobacteria bacterium]
AVDCKSIYLGSTPGPASNLNKGLAQLLSLFYFHNAKARPRGEFNEINGSITNTTRKDSRRTVTNEISRYRNKNHNTYIGSNGSIKIETVIGKKVLLDKTGLNGKKVGDL